VFLVLLSEDFLSCLCLENWLEAANFQGTIAANSRDGQMTAFEI